VLFEEGEPGDRLYVITSGKVKLGRRSPDGRENLLAVLGPGEMFGELSLFDPGARTTTATAVAGTDLVGLGHAELTEFVSTRPEVAVKLLGSIARRLRRTNEALGDLVFTDVPGRVAKALLGKDVLPDDAPFVTGSIGLLGTKPSWELMQNCDTLLMIGSGFPWTEFLPEEGKARAVQIDIDPAMLGLRYPCEVNLHGDAAETLRALLPLLEHKEDRSWQEEIAVQVRDWWKVMEDRAHAPANPVNPQRVVWEMSPQLPDNAIVTSDSGSCANWFARDYRVKQGQRATLSGGLACMGAAVPYAIAAKFAHPDRPVVALVGDGAMQMNNMAELITIQKYWQQWSDPRLIVCVFNNQDLNQVTWEQRVMEGNARFEATQQLPDVRYAQFAESLGLQGIFVDNPDELEDAWRRALSADRPVVLEVKTDPEVAPLPPHITFKQAKAFMSSMAKGDRGAAQIISDTASQLLHKK